MLLPDQNKYLGDVNYAGVQFLPYVTLRKYLLEVGKRGFFNNTNLPPTLANLLPIFKGSPPNFWVSSAVAKIFRMPGVNVGVDGFVGIGKAFSPGAERVSAFLHEIGHALGRVPENSWGTAIRTSRPSIQSGPLALHQPGQSLVRRQ